MLALGDAVVHVSPPELRDELTGHVAALSKVVISAPADTAAGYSPGMLDAARARSYRWDSPEAGFEEAKWRAPGPWGLHMHDTTGEPNNTFYWFDSLEHLAAWIPRVALQWYADAAPDDYDPDALLSALVERLSPPCDFADLTRWLATQTFGDSEVDWIGRPTALYESDDEFCKDLREQFREEEDAEGGDWTAPLAESEREAFAEWLAAYKES